ncbi:MAG: hypothetical protein Q8N06_02805 [Hydrogenophaga sp.]|nr:hypothetical protein [Hydrogenophaga sp.]
MAVITAIAGTRTTVTTTALNSLASAAYVSAGTVDVSATDPIDDVVEVEATPGTVAGNKQLVVFIQVSFDNTNFSTGPVSGTTTTDEPNLRQIGVLPLNTNATLQRGAFSIMSALGYVPPYYKIIVKNDSGAALAASGHAVYHTPYTGNSA